MVSWPIDSRLSVPPLPGPATGSAPPGGVPVVLFLCVHNAGRSQMAMAWFNHLAGARAVARSGGSDPGRAVNPAAVAAMGEIGIDIAGAVPSAWTDEVVRAADVVVTMGCGDTCPVFPGTRYGDWGYPTPRAGRWTPSARSATRSAAGCAPCWTALASPPSPERRPARRAG